MDTSPARRRLRAALGSAVRYGDHARADRTRTALAVERAAESLGALHDAPTSLTHCQAERLMEAVSGLPVQDEEVTA